jgi:RHS repeat-associated protein
LSGEAISHVTDLMGQRFYDPAIGRFLQPDSIVPHTKNPQSLNRFSHVDNNPLRYTDRCRAGRS